jgi:CubicO group peptidase (beta-lactamase class C family)
MHAVVIRPTRWARVGALAAATQKARIDAAIREAFKTNGIHAVIVQATVNGKTVIKKAYGQSMTGIPASVNMHFCNGNVVAMYMSTLLLKLVEPGKAKLGNPISKCERPSAPVTTCGAVST